VGAHNYPARGPPGPNDNATGVAAVFEIARALKDAHLPRTIRYVAFVNEEPPFFQTELMGSAVYAKACKARGEKIVAMITPETIGYYSDAKGSQHYPMMLGLFYPRVGNFIAFVGESGSQDLVARCVASFRGHTQFPSEGGAAPSWIEGVGWSDHWSFQREGYPALMVTDTAPFRYKHYHTPQDTPDKIDYDRTARVVAGLVRWRMG
jgi:Zn-dependent M28 family amino/carboxypeptidase